MKISIKATTAERYDRGSRTVRVTFEGLAPDTVPLVGSVFEIEIPDPPKSPGEIAFDAFNCHAHGETRLGWDSLSPAGKAHWQAAASAVLAAEPKL